jgi:polyisoprenyl-phosphate glycosyltransferase
MSNTFHILSPRENPGLLSLVIPIYNEEEVLSLLIDRLKALLEKLPSAAEVILVNDGSSDRTLEGLYAIAQADQRFKVLGLARNFGHQIAATAGLDVASGDAIVLMDADLQDPPELILEMLAQYRMGFDVVYAQRTAREGEGAFKRFSAWFFYRLMRWMVYKDLPPDVGDYRLVSRRCWRTMQQMRETHRFLRGMVRWVGFPQTAVTFARPQRAAGETKYPLRKMLFLAWTAAVSFSPLPLRMSLVAGAVIFMIGFAYTLYALSQLILGYYLVPGWTSLIILNCMTAGAILLAIGVLGEYVARIFEEIKDRPLYTVSNSLNLPPMPEDQRSAL